MAKYDLGVHARARRADPASPAATCVDCHTAHEIKAASDPTSTTYKLNLVGVRPLSRRSRDHQPRIEAGNVPASFHDSIHGQALEKAGLIVALACGDATARTTSSRRATPRARSTGRRCRQRAARVMRALGSCLPPASTAGRWREACRARRRARRATRRTASSAPSARAGSSGRSRSAARATPRRSTYRDTFHGQVQSLGFARIAKCADCHTAHAIHPKEDPRSSVSPANVVATCRQCHPSATENVVGRSARRQTRPGAVAARLLRGAGHERAARRCVHLLRPAHDAVVLARISRAAISGRSGATE